MDKLPYLGHDNNLEFIDKRRRITMQCFDKLPEELKVWIQNLHFNLHDDHILRGAEEVAKCKEYIEKGGQPHFYETSAQN